MNRTIGTVLQIIAVAMMLWLPVQSAHAALVQCDPSVIGSCDLCALLATIQSVVNFIISMAFVLLTLVIMIAGFQMYMSQGNPGAFSRSIQQIWNGVIGLVITLAAWVIVNTVLHFFAHGSVLFWNRISC